MNFKYLFIVQNKFILDWGKRFSVSRLEKAYNSYPSNSSHNYFMGYWVGPYLLLLF